ncbi:hypothetical protein GCM10023189_60590 [Nibrella saemangeumensis]|uniref:DUF5615 domain-containing protein n=1 Tax=Nibrella saemangeumensis TaxID=1084526 RepID=A0ABP8NQ04_9BACT
MKLLLDENLPKQLKNDLPNHEVYHVSDKHWNSKKNGELLQAMLADGFDVLLTFDKNLQHQQNFEKYPIIVFVLIAPKNQHQYLQPLMQQVNQLLQHPLKHGATIIS